MFYASLFAISLSVSGAMAAPVTWSATGHSYERFDTPKTWYAAEADAISRGGYLATLTSVDENAWVWNTLGAPAYHLIGGTDQLKDGDWKWVTGELWAYSNWNSREPNNSGGKEDALEFWNNGKWNDTVIDKVSGAWNEGYIVEYNPAPVSNHEPVPEPSAFFLLAAGILGFGLIQKRTGK